MQLNNAPLFSGGLRLLCRGGGRLGNLEHFRAASDNWVDARDVLLGDIGRDLRHQADADIEDNVDRKPQSSAEKPRAAL